MAAYPRLQVDESVIRAAVTELERRFAPDVVRINYAIEENWFGEPSIFFRVLVTDKASRPKRMDVVAPAVENAIWSEIDPVRRWDLFAYIHFRNESEQAELKDPGWA